MKKSRKIIKMITMTAAAAVYASIMTGCSGSESANSGNVAKEDSYADTITLVWYPNESADNFEGTRDEIGRLIEQATGKKVEQKLTTDYAIAIESISSGSAQIGCMFGGEGYIQAKNANDAVELLLVNSDSAGTLDNAMYYSFFAVNEEDSSEYTDGSSYSIDNIQGKKMSFVSNSSTSGFKVPTNGIISHFADSSDWSALKVDDLLEGGSDAFFSEVLFGGSHQGSAFNLISGKADVAAFCDTEIAPYASCTSGEENQVGSVYTINDDAEAPFDTVTGETFTVISSTPVMNGPFVYNSDTISPEDVKAIQTLFTSDEVANNERIFYPEDSETKGAYKKTDNERFVLVEDSWYDPIRNMQ